MIPPINTPPANASVPPAPPQEQRSWLSEVWQGIKTAGISAVRAAAHLTASTISKFPSGEEAKKANQDRFSSLFQGNPTLQSKVERSFTHVITEIAQSCTQPTILGAVEQGVFDSEGVQQSLQNVLKHLFANLHESLSIPPQQLSALMRHTLHTLTVGIRTSHHLFTLETAGAPSQPLDITTTLSQALLTSVLPKGAESIPTELLCRAIPKDFVYRQLEGILHSQIDKVIKSLLSERIERYILANVLDSIHSILDTGCSTGPGKWSRVTDSALNDAFHAPKENGDTKVTLQVQEFIDTCYSAYLPLHVRLFLTPLKRAFTQKIAARLEQDIATIDIPRILTNVCIATGEVLEEQRNIPQEQPTTTQSLGPDGRPMDNSLQGDQNVQDWITYLSSPTAIQKITEKLTSQASLETKKSLEEMMSDWPWILGWLKICIQWITATFASRIVRRAAQHNLKGKDMRKIAHDINLLLHSEAMKQRIAAPFADWTKTIRTGASST